MPTKPKLPQAHTPSARDMFQTPTYATKLLVPFIPYGVKTIWEPACGKGKISSVLSGFGYSVLQSDLFPQMDNCDKQDFLSIWDVDCDCIITNPPYSLKKEFFFHCHQLGIPFALLIPADYSGWIIAAIENGAEKIIPTRRIDYITPTGLSGSASSGMFHSMWLTWGFKLGKTETFVTLTNETKRSDV